MLRSRLHQTALLVCVALALTSRPSEAQGVPVDFFDGVVFEEPMPTEFSTGDWVLLKGFTDDPEVYQIVFQFAPFGSDEPVAFPVPVVDGHFEHRVVFEHDQAGRYGLELLILGPSFSGAPSLRFFTITVAAGSGPIVVPPEVLEALLNPARFTPNVTLASAEILPRLRVRASPTAQSVTAFTMDEGGVEHAFTLRDDGLDGDEVAGDGVFIHDGLPMPAGELSFDGFGVRNVRVQIIASDGTLAVLGAECGLVGGGPVQVWEAAPGVRRTERLISLVDPALFSARAPASLDLAAVTRRFHELFPDVFDLLHVRSGAVMSNGLYGLNVLLREHTRGIGLAPQADPADYGNPQRLMAVVFTNFLEVGPLVHEVGHTWANWFDLFEWRFWGAHWGFSDVDGILGGQDFSYTRQDDGSFVFPLGVATSYWGGQYSALELFAMGLVPPTDVGPHVVLRDPEVVEFTDDGASLIVNGRLDTVTVDDILAAEGPRLPGHRDARRRFRMATVVVSHEPLSDLALTYCDRQMAFFASDSEHELAFAQATGYRATMDTRLDRPVTAISEGSGASLPAKIALVGAYPNPFNASTVVAYRLPTEGDVELTVHNLLGQPVRRLRREHQPAGEYLVAWDGLTGHGSPAASGIYFIRLQAGETASTVKVTLAR